jgi:hypothetical protein
MQINNLHRQGSALPRLMLNGQDVIFHQAFHREEAETGLNMNRKKIYWLSQLSGWSLFLLFNLIIIASFYEFSWKRAGLWIFLCALGILFTNLFRKKIKDWGWFDLPLKKIIPRVLIASIILGSLMFLILFPVNLAANIYEVAKFKPAQIVIAAINLISIIFLWSLIYFSFHFFENYKRAEIESYIWEAAVKDFELKTLKSQLNPHFMFNALNSIRALIKEDPQSAQIAVTKLSNILRYSLKIERNETVPLEEEIQTVEDYLALETIRFEERLKYKINMDPRSAKIEIPPMMVQTLVENGIKHGISKKTHGGEISICTKVIDFPDDKHGSQLHIEIENSGRIDTEQLKHAKGFGINNTKHRLNLLFGERAIFSIKNESKDKVLAELIIPIGGKINESFNSR